MIRKKRNILLTWKEELLTSAVIVVCLVLFFFFPAQGPAQAATASLAFLFLIPFLYLKLTLKKNLKDHGWQMGDWKKGLVFASISLIASLLIFYALYHYTPLPKMYRLPAFVANNFWLFLLYEFILVGFFLALYEFFFRGLVLFSFLPKTGRLSVLIQWFFFAAFLALSENFKWQNAPYLIVAVFAGLIAYKSRSLLYSFSFGLFFLIIFDAVIIKLLY